MKNFVINVAKKAGDAILKHFNRDKIIKIKSKSQIVTQADLVSDRIIIREIKKRFPGHRILTEESGIQGSASEYVWIVDPLDGTTNYSAGNPLFAVSIGLAKNGQIILGVIYAPHLKELYYAEKHKGATLNGKKIKVSAVSSIGKSFLTYCHGNAAKDIRRSIDAYKKIKFVARDVRQLGSAAISLGFVASGRAESIVIPGANSWDVAAGVLLVREAGGRVTDINGADWNLKSRDMIATNGRIHSRFLKFLK